MADSTVAALTAASSLTGTELFYGVQSANDVKVTASQIAAFAGGGMAIGGSITSATLGSVLFAGAAGVLAQDNTNFFWDNTNFLLKLGNASSTASIYLNAVPAIYEVPNTSGNNWFEGNAGNVTMTGNNNFGTGDNCLATLTTGSGNTGVGINCLGGVTTGNNNFAFGTSALRNLSTGSSNVAIGPFNMQSGHSSSNNVAVGVGVLGIIGNGVGNQPGNIGIGSNVVGSLVTGYDNVFIGQSLGANLTDAYQNVSIGSFSMGGASGSSHDNTIIGVNAGGNPTTLVECTIIGSWLGPSASLTGVIALSDGANHLRMDYGFTHASTWTFAAPYMTAPVATSALPAAGVAGRRAFVNDATATTFASIVAGTGSNKVPVYDDGTNWRIG